jgi:MoaA/NifB/PqqE/SkfB family radical SAM enzyme
MIQSTRTPLELARQGTTGAELGKDVIDVWFITDMVLCNFDCAYCCAYSVVTQKKQWHEEGSYERFLKITEEIAKTPYTMRMRVQTLGEPLVSKQFLERAAWLTARDNVAFVELVTNGSLCTQKLPFIEEKGGDLSKLSLWTTYHHTEIKMEKFFAEVEYAQERGCFVVVNSLAFPDNIEVVEELHAECTKRGLRINVDPGYRDGGGEYDQGGPLVPILEMPGGRERLDRLTANKNVLEANLRAADTVDGELCSAGGDYFIVLADGRVGPCCPLLSKGMQLGNILDDEFTLGPGKKKYQVCSVDRRVPVLSHLPVIGEKFRTRWPCKNKEDFTHLKSVRASETLSPSLGWLGS